MDSFEPLSYALVEVLQVGILVEFVTQEATCPRVLRECFSLICREIFNPANSLLLCFPNECWQFFTNPGECEIGKVIIMF